MFKITLSDALITYENRISGKFKPDVRFYRKVGINQKRFGQLLRGEKPIFYHEVESLAKFFEVPIERILKKENPATTANSAGLKTNV